MREKILLVLVCLLGLAVGGLVASLLISPVQVETKNVVVEQKIVQYNDSSVQNKLNEIEKKLNEDDIFKAKAIALAKEELADRDYKKVFAFLDDEKGDIKEKSDIISVQVRKEKVNSFDKEEGNAEVELELKVYYEDVKGDKVKEYITAYFSIEDLEVVDYEFELD